MQSAPTDTFARDNLPPRELWPDLINLDKLGYPERLNAAVELLDRQVEAGRGDHPAVIGSSATWSYRELAERVNRIANVLVGELGFEPGNRVLIRSANNPMMVAVYFAVLKAGGVVVATMPLLRPRELSYIIEKAPRAVRLLRCAPEGRSRQGGSGHGGSAKDDLFFYRRAGRPGGENGGGFVQLRRCRHRR
jgi:2-aminobenzoate-CoA ligase